MISIKEQLQNKMVEIIQVSELIRPLILAANNVHWELYRLPLIDKKSENDKPDNISCDTDRSESAKFDLLKGLFNFYADLELSTKAAQRTPGYFHIMMSELEFKELNDYLETINTVSYTHLTLPTNREV